MRRLFILGHPGLYGGAGTELHHQIQLWAMEFKDIELHIIPTMQGYKNEPLYNWCLSLGITYHEPMNFDAITKDDAIINFCGEDFLKNLEKIHQKTDKLLWVNCMTYLFNLEKENAHKNYIKFYLYQRDGIRIYHERQLKKMGAKGEFIRFAPYTNPEGFQFSERDGPTINIGHISRADPHKFAKNTLSIYEGIHSPKRKMGIFLGYSDKISEKIGKPHDWIRTYPNQNHMKVKDFYEDVDFIVQPTDTFENWPRIGFEAMFSGKPLIVDKRGGWESMIEHGVSGFLCKHERDFMYWGSRMAYEPCFRRHIAENAVKRAISLSSAEVSAASWRIIFDKVFN